MNVLRWLLVVLAGLYGLAELFLSLTTLAVKLRVMSNAAGQPIADATTWPLMIIWVATGALSMLGAVLLARRNPTALPAFGFAIVATLLQQYMVGRSAAYAKLFSPDQRQLDWYVVATLAAVAVGMFLVLRRDRAETLV
jgi:hypothetical protein